MKQSQPITVDFWQCQVCLAIYAATVKTCRICGNDNPKFKNSLGNMAFPAILGGKPVSEPVTAINAAKNGKKPRFRETELQKACEKWLRFHGVEYLHLSPFSREKVGWPDLVFAIDGQPFAIELKNATGKLKPEQAERLENMAANGWRIAVIRTFDEFINFVNYKKGEWR